MQVKIQKCEEVETYTFQMNDKYNSEVLRYKNSQRYKEFHKLKTLGVRKCKMLKTSVIKNHEE